MTSQDAVTLTAASVGFVAAVFFCVGNFMNNSESIFKQSRPFNDISKPIAHALSAQRAQYVTGGLLLVIAFSSSVGSPSVKRKRRMSSSMASFLALSCAFRSSTICRNWLLYFASPLRFHDKRSFAAIQAATKRRPREIWVLVIHRTPNRAVERTLRIKPRKAARFYVISSRKFCE